MPAAYWTGWVAAASAATVFGAWWHRRRRGDNPWLPPAAGVSPSDLLYSLPTLCDQLPPLENAHPAADPVVLDEDDWRQIEFVAADQMADVRRELTELQQFKAAAWTGQAWRNVFLRTSRLQALAHRGIRLSALEGSAPSLVRCRQLALRVMGTVAQVKSGFALELSPAVVLYGHLVNNAIASLGVSSSAKEFERTTAAPILAAICDAYHLALVDWNRSTVVEWERQPARCT